MSGTGKYWQPQQVRYRYRAIVRMGSGQLIIARGTYSGMLEAEREVSKWVILLNHLYPNARVQKIQRIRNGTS